MYTVSFYQYPPKEIEAVDFYVQDSVFLFVDGKSTVAAFPVNTVSGVIHVPDPTDYEDPDWDDDENDYDSPLTEEERKRYDMLNKPVDVVYSKGIANTLKQQTPLDSIFDRKPLPVFMGNEIQFFECAPQTVGPLHPDYRASSVEEQIPSDPSHYIPFVDWKAGFAPLQSTQQNPTLSELLNQVHEAQARVDARFAEITARMKQESESKAALDDLVNEKY